MSLASYIAAKFLGKRYDAGAVVLGAGEVLAAVRALSPGCAWTPADGSYIALQPARLRDFLADNVDLSFCRYHSNSDEFPDCDDFARICQAQVVKAAIQNGMKRAPAFFELALTLVGGSRHAPNLCLDATRKVWLFEPQAWARSNPLSDDYSLIASLDELEG